MKKFKYKKSKFYNQAKILLIKFKHIFQIHKMYKKYFNNKKK